MLCTECRDGFLCEPIPRTIVLSYRGFSKQVGTLVYLSCSNCCHASTDPLKTTFDIDAELVNFKREINKQLSVGEII